MYEMTVINLPSDYVEIRRINLQKDKKLAILLNALAFVIAILMIIVGLIFVPFSMYDYYGVTANSLERIMLKPLLLTVAMFFYFILHEVIHGIFMKIFSGVKARLGFTGIYGYAASDAYFGKSSYLVITLAPVVILGLILLSLNICFSSQWFWFFYLLQIFNVSGATGDLYVTLIMSKMSKDVLTRDTGISMSIYSKSGEAELK